MKDRIDTIGLFPILNRELVDLLRSLNTDDFNKTTQFPSWKVKDICAHLLDTSIRRLSVERDHYQSPGNFKLESYGDLINHITELADRWASAFIGVSPKILIELLDKYQNELYEHLLQLRPYDESTFAVSWAGEEKSFNWFDIAREYTERWHHQMQIREALNKEPLYERYLYFPVLDTFMRALPYHYRNWKMEKGHIFCVEVSGNAGGKWYLEWNDRIELSREMNRKSQTHVSIDQENAWKIFTRWNDRSVYHITVNGNKELGEYILEMNCLLIKK